MHIPFVHSEFEKRAIESPHKIAVEDSGRQVTYRELNQKANQVANALMQLGLQDGAMVAVLLAPQIDLVMTFLAILKSRNVYLPIDIKAPENKQKQLLTLQQCQILVTNEERDQAVTDLLDKLNISIRYRLQILNDGSFRLKSKEGELPLSDLPAGDLSLSHSPDDACYLFSTSGSTGIPKLILGRYESLSHFIQWEIQEFKLDKSCRVSMLSQITFDASLRDIFIPLTVGGTLCIPPPDFRTNIMELKFWLNKSKVNLIHVVPSIYRLLLNSIDAGERIFEDLQYVLMAGEILYARDILETNSRIGSHVEIVNLYGTSETTMAKTFHRVKVIPENRSEIIHVGKPISDAWVLIVNDSHQLCRIGEIGEVYIKTPFMTKGYLNDDLANKSAFVQNPLVTGVAQVVYKTGDLGRYLENRNIEILGRLDDQVKVNGIRVQLKEIERAVRGITGLEDAVITVYCDNDLNNQVICYYTNPQMTSQEIRKQLKGEIEPSLIPSYFVRLEKFPLGATGKVNLKQLPLPEEIIFKDVEYIASGNQIESALESIWKELLNYKRISTNVSFFDIGGNSLKAMQVIMHVYKNLNKSIHIKDIFENPTIKELAVVVENAVQNEYADIPTLPTADYYDLSHSQMRQWLQSQSEGAQVAYNMSISRTLIGNLNVEALRHALNSLVERHEILRTTFVLVDGVVKQKVNSFADCGFGMHYIDMRHDDHDQDMILAIVQKRSEIVFDLEKGPLINACLFQTDEDTYVFIVTVHHIVADAWSMEIMITEAEQFYNAFCNGETLELEPLRIHYNDFAKWQRGQLETKSDGRNSETFWLSQFSDNIPATQMPFDFPGKHKRTFQGKTIFYIVDEDLTARIRKLTAEHSVSLFTVLFSAVTILVHYYTGLRDMVIGTPVAGRYHHDLKNQVGYYVNALPLRVSIGPHWTIAEFLKRNHDYILQAFNHQDYPFDLLVEKLNIDMEPGRSPLFDITFIMQSDALGSKQTESMKDIDVKPFNIPFNASKNDIRFEFTERLKKIYANTEFNTDLFSEATIRRMNDNLLTLLEEFVKDDGRTALSDIKLSLSDEQEEFIMNILKDTTAI